MEAVINSALPFFALILAGYGAGRTKILDDTAIEGLNRFVFYFALPTLLFVKIGEAPIREQLDWRFLAGYSGSSLAVFLTAGLIGRLVWRHDLAAMAMQGLTASFSNVGYMGLPLVILALGDAAALPGVVVLVLDNVVLLSLASALIEIGLHGRDSHPAIVVARVFRGLVRHPLIVAIFLGGTYAFTGLSLPAPVAAFGTLLGAAAGPCALFALGATLVGRPVSGGIGEVAYLTVFKLALHPALVWLVLGAGLGLDPFWVGVAVLQAAMPVGANAFVMARQYGVYVARASTAILVSTATAVVTVSFLVARFAGG